MATIKARATITVAWERDILATYRFYRITASTSTPSAPTVAEGKTFVNSGTVPSGWSKVEPAYDGTSTNSLYIVDLTSFSDSDVIWSDVSKSSSYEASKQAYNKADLVAETVGDVQGSVETIQRQASDASDSAGAANTVLDELKRILEIDKWVNTHCTCEPTVDTEVISGKLYFTLSEDNEYVSITPDEDADPSSLGLYELKDINNSISDFLATRIVEEDGELSVQTENIKTKLVLTGYGLHLVNENGEVISTFSDIITLGNKNGMHVTLSPGDSESDPPVLPELGFWNGDTKVAYINANTLNIKQSRIEEILHIGQFAWKVQSANRISLVYIPG